jgi:phage terminase large subunit-like protein
MNPTSTKRRQSEAARAAGDRAVQFFCKRLYLTKGRPVPFVPTPDQAAYLRAVFGTLNPDGRRKYRTIYREIPKKNSKTTDTAGCLLKCLFDEDEYGGEVYSAAATRDQAGQTYRKMAASVRRSPALFPKFRGKPVKLYDRDKRIYVAALDAFYQALSSDANYEDGIEPSAAAVDELHRHRTRDLLDVVQEGMGARDQPLLFINTTAGAFQTGPAWDMHCYATDVLAGIVDDPTFYAQIYAAPAAADWEDEAVWYACNPMLRAGILDIEDFRRAHRQAQRIPTAKTAFLRLRLNQWVATSEAWLDVTAWDACGRSSSPEVIARRNAGRPCFGGLDLSSTSDFTALSWWFPNDDDDGADVFTRLWVPEGSLDNRARMRDDIRAWARAGYVELVPGTRMDYRAVAAQIAEDCHTFDVQALGFDPWHAPHIITLLDEFDLDRLEMVKVNQYPSVMNAPCRLFEKMVADGTLDHGGSPLLRWQASNVIAEVNPYEAMRPSKRRSGDSIDGITSMLIALERAMAPREKRGYAGVVAV